MQIANSFDKESVKKAIVGAIIAGIVPGVIAMLYSIQSSLAGNIELNAFCVVAIPTLVYLVRKVADGSIKPVKLAISLGLSLIGGLIIWFGQQNLGQWAILAAWAIPSAVNAIKEYLRGQCGQCTLTPKEDAL